jgi:hypothetical protein
MQPAVASNAARRCSWPLGLSLLDVTGPFHQLGRRQFAQISHDGFGYPTGSSSRLPEALGDDNIVAMSTLGEIQAAAVALSPEEQEELVNFLTSRLRGARHEAFKARVVNQGEDTLLEASPSAPPMTPENVRSILDNC